MNIIFLDIDGVLNCEEFYTKRKNSDLGTYPLCEFDPFRIMLLNDLIAATDAKIVISSTWRLGRSTEELINIFREVGFVGEIIDCTPSLRHEGCLRGNEILFWIKENEDIVGPYYDYKSYVIIDDDSDMLLWQRPHFFQTDTYSGLTPNLCHKIKQFFKHKTFFTNDK
jgi:HAD domain in Swiss Army Knife RNA repair proteins